MKLVVALLTCVVVAITAPAAHAGPSTTLVLPVDGDADPALRARLTSSVEKLARAHGGKVTVGDTTFAETAAAVGCDPAAATCAEMVRSTLGVDVLVYGTATTTNGQTTVVVKRAAVRKPPRGASVVVTAEDPPERAEAGLTPVFDESVPTAENPDQPPPPPEQPGPPGYPNGKRTKGIVVASAGGLSLIIGFALWSNKASVQDDIDSAPTDDAADFARLEELERRASKYAWVGNVMVLGGLALAGYGGWILYQDRQERQLAITPAVTPTSAGVTIGGRW